MNKNVKRLVVSIGGLIILLILGYQVLIWFFGTQFTNTNIYFLPSNGGTLGYGEDLLINRKPISTHVQGVYEIDNKLYYVTLDGIGIFNEKVGIVDSAINNVESYNHFVARKSNIDDKYHADIKATYPDFDSFDLNEQDVWTQLMVNDDKAYRSYYSGEFIKFPFYIAARNEIPIKHNDLIDLSIGKKIGEDVEHIVIGDIFYGFNWGELTKIDLTTGEITKYYSNKLTTKPFLKDAQEKDSYQSITLNEQDPIVLNRIPLKGIYKERLTIHNKFDQFSLNDQENFEKIIRKAIESRQRLTTKLLDNLSLKKYLDESNYVL